MICLFFSIFILFCKAFGIDVEIIADGNAFGLLMLVEIVVEFTVFLFWTIRN